MREVVRVRAGQRRVSWAATRAWPRSSTPSGRVTVPVASATTSIRAPRAVAKFVETARSAAERISVRATTT